jgi:hypothetical protein
MLTREQIEDPRRARGASPERVSLDLTPSSCAVGSWGGRRPSLGGYVTGTGATSGVTTGGRR